MNTTYSVRGISGIAAFLACLAWPSLQAMAGQSVTIERHKPCNLFPAGEPVRFNVDLRGFPAGEGAASAAVSNYFGEGKTTTQPLKPEAGASSSLSLDLGILAPGYYELTLDVSVKTLEGKAASGRAGVMSFGVVGLISRSAEEARRQGSRFGLKIFQIGKPGVWWRRPLKWELAEAVDACAGLGLQWTRHLLNQEPSEEPGIIGTQDLIAKHAMNVVLKIEGFPESCYDLKRYGPLEDWKQKKKSWSRNTVPLKEPYQQWLRGEIAKIPPGQDVFEIGNEVWNYMSAEEFAEWCRLVVPVVRELRPGAVLGADPGGRDYGKRFIVAGGMDGMNAVFIHPYSFTPMPEHRIRPWLRNTHDMIRERLGKDLPLYTTEYGWSTAPQNAKYGKTERQQAQRTVRESLMLYAEGCKTLIPHWMADREQDPKEREHWFGFFRLNAQPKPVLIAHAVSARMIDCSRFVGDLWLGPGVGALLFERAGVYTLGLWTMDEDLGAGRDVSIDAGTTNVTVVDIMGRERKAASPGGRLTLKASGDMTYVVGVSPNLSRLAVGPDKDLIDGCWNTRLGTNVMARAKSPPRVDGLFGDWAGMTGLQFGSPATNSGKPQAEVFLNWDRDNLYLAVRAQDDVVVNDCAPSATGKVAGITGGDAFELTLCTRPSRQTLTDDYGKLYEYTLTVSPTSAAGGPALQLSNIVWDQPVLNPSATDPSGLRWAAGPTNGGWIAEVAIPIRLLKGFPESVPGARLSFQMRILDTDRKGIRPAVTTYAKTEQHMEWPSLVLGE